MLPSSFVNKCTNMEVFYALDIHGVDNEVVFVMAVSFRYIYLSIISTLAVCVVFHMSKRNSLGLFSFLFFFFKKKFLHILNVIILQ